jgi:septal ring factor EnvC (AmiA/AmiB activator)
MTMRTTVFWACLGLLAGGLAATAGCGDINAHATIPSSWAGAPPPPGNIAPADPKSQPDLARENAELKARLAWLEDQNRSLEKKYNSQGKDLAEIREEMNKIAAERDRYKRASGN